LTGDWWAFWSAVYNWVHPNNQAILAFLARRGYRVLNLIEIRRPLPGETLAGQVTVGPHTLTYPVPIQREREAGSGNAGKSVDG